MEIKKVSIIGMGTMGLGIAQLAAQSEFEVTVFDSDMSTNNNAIKKIAGNLDKSIEKGKVDLSERESILGRINRSKGLNT